MADADALWQFLKIAEREHGDEVVAVAARQIARQPTLPPQLERAAVDAVPEAPGVYLFGHSEGLGAQSIETWVGPIDTFAMGNETIRDTAIHFGDLFKDVAVTGSGGPAARGVPRLPQMLLGSDFLRTHRVLLSHSQRKMYFYYLGGQVFQPRRPAAPPARALPATGDARSR